MPVVVSVPVDSAVLVLLVLLVLPGVLLLGATKQQAAAVELDMELLLLEIKANSKNNNFNLWGERECNERLNCLLTNVFSFSCFLFFGSQKICGGKVTEK